jgi:DNA-binding beta-propeller fold protein YncE
MAHTGGATVSMLDPRTGVTLRPLAACLNPVALGVSVRTGHLFAKCNDGTTVMLDERTGRLLARTQTESTYGCLLVDERTNRIFELGTPMVGQHHLDMLDAQTGALLRATAGLGLPNSAEQALGGRRDCPYATVDGRTGRIYIALRGPGELGTRAARSEVALVDGRTGTILRRFPVAENPVAVAVDSQTGRLLVASVGTVDGAGLPLGNGTLSVLDAASGRVRRTLTVGLNPTAVVIDERRGHALVLNSNTDIEGLGLTVNPLRPGTVTTIDLSRL